MNKTILYILMLCMVQVGFTACENDDTDFSDYINTSNNTEGDEDDNNNTSSPTTGNDTIYIAYNNMSVTVAGDNSHVVSINGADVVVNSSSDTYMVLVLSGFTSDGSLLIYREKKFEVLLNGVNITNLEGPAINNQCSKSFYVKSAEGTENTLTDGTSYAVQNYDQKGALFSEGQIFFRGTGSLTINGNCKNGVASDDYVTIEEGANVTIHSKGTNGLKANDGVFIEGGTLTINVTSNGARGIRSEARTVITGGVTTITTSGDCLIETINGVADTTSAAGIKSDSLFSMSAGQLTITSKGDGGKGINCSGNVEFSGGTLFVTTTGENDEGKPKAIKSDTGIIVSGGSFTASCKKSWACDNSTESDNPADRLTVKGTPERKELTKRLVLIEY